MGETSTVTKDCPNGVYSSWKGLHGELQADGPVHGSKMSTRPLPVATKGKKTLNPVRPRKYWAQDKEGRPECGVGGFELFRGQWGKAGRHERRSEISAGQLKLAHARRIGIQLKRKRKSPEYRGGGRKLGPRRCKGRVNGKGNISHLKTSYMSTEERKRSNDPKKVSNLGSKEHRQKKSYPTMKGHSATEATINRFVKESVGYGNKVRSRRESRRAVGLELI